MSHLAEAIAFIRVSHRSLDHLEVAFEEQSLLRIGLAALDAVLYRDRLGICRAVEAPASLSGREVKKSHHRCDKFCSTRSLGVRRYTETSQTTPNADVRCCKSAGR
jgi:hypothetical protein